MSPIMAVELARRSIPPECGPRFRRWKAPAAAAASRFQGGLTHGPQQKPLRRHPAAPKIFIIKRKKGGHGGHHGGAWKVAYADFVTAMMALFIVLWLMSADKEVQESVSAYFNNPTGPGNMTGTAAAGWATPSRCRRTTCQACRENPAGAQDGARISAT